MQFLGQQNALSAVAPPQTQLPELSVAPDLAALSGSACKEGNIGG